MFRSLSFVAPCSALTILASIAPSLGSAQASPVRHATSTTEAADSGRFVVRRGQDTVAVETFSRSGTNLAGTLAVHDRENTAQRWRAVVAPDATLPLIEVTVLEDRQNGEVKAKMRQQARVIFKGDSVAVDDVNNNGLQTRVFATHAGAIPYLNLSFALLEQGIRRARSAGSAAADHVPLFNLGGGQTVDARLTPSAGDSLSLAIGTVDFRLRVDQQGRILGGSIPSQNVTVERVGS